MAARHGAPTTDVVLRGCGTLSGELTWPPSCRGCSGRSKQTELSMGTAAQPWTADWGRGRVTGDELLRRHLSSTTICIL